MNLLKTIIERLNQRVEVSNIFDQIYPLCELNANGNEKAWVHYIGNGQAEVVTNFDAKQGTLFWAKRGKVSVTKTESLKVSGCKTLYLTTFPLTAYAVVRKSHLPCDSEDSQDWIASRIYRLISGTDPDFKVSIGVIQYEVIPNGYINEIKSLTSNYEWACVAVDVDVNVVSSSEDGCYDVCATGDIPLPDFQPCTPCLTEVAVDGLTITGNGTTANPLVAVVGDSGLKTAIAFSTDHLSSTGNQYVIGNVVWYLSNIYRCIASNDSILPTNTAFWTNLGAGFQTIERPIDWNATSGNNQILNKPTIPSAQVNSDWNSSSGVSEILNKPTIPILPATIVEDVTATLPMSSSGGTTPDISISQADGTTDGYLSQTDWNTFDGKFDVPTGTSADYLDGTGAPTLFPSIPAAQIQSDWNQSNNVALDFIKNKPSIPTVNPSALTKTDDTNVTITLGGSPSTSLLAATSLTMGWSGTLADARIASAATWNAKQNAITTGTTSQYFRGDLSLDTFPTSLPPSGAASGDLSGTYPNPTVHKIHGVDMQSGTPTADDLWIYGGAPSKWQHGKIKTINSTSLIGTGNITTGTVTSVAALTLGTTGTDLSSTVATGTTTPVITLNVPTASAANRGALSATDWTTFNSKQAAITPAALTKVDDTNVTLTLGGTPTTALLQAASITAGWSGTLADARITSAATWNAKQNALGFTPVTDTRMININGVSQDLTADRSWTIATATNYKSGIDSASFSGINNTAVYTQLITANTFISGDIIRTTFRARKTGNNGVMALRIYVNATPDVLGTPILMRVATIAGTTNNLSTILAHFTIKNATNNTETYSTSGSSGTDFGQFSNVTTAAINWTLNRYIVFVIQNSNATDVNFGSMYLIEKL